METRKLAMELQELIYLMNRQMAIEKCHHHEIRPHDLMILNGINGINDGNPVKMSDISRYFKMSAPAISQIIRRYEQYGYIIREVSSQDRRNVYIQISQDTKRMLLDEAEKMNEKMIAILDYLGEEDAEQFVRIMKRLTQYRTIEKGRDICCD